MPLREKSSSSWAMRSTSSITLSKLSLRARGARCEVELWCIGKHGWLRVFRRHVAETPMVGSSFFINLKKVGRRETTVHTRDRQFGLEGDA